MTNFEITEANFQQITEESDAVLLAVGATQHTNLNIAGIVPFDLN